MRVPKFAVILAVLASGCTGGASDTVAFELTDSSGVAIAYSGIAPGDTSGWGVTVTPVLDIGVMEGDPAYQFFRISWVTRLPDGGIVVVNAGSQEVRYFTPDGVHVRTVGRTGDGPNEFRVPIGVMGRAQDSVTVWDPQSRRLTVLTPGGEFTGSTTVTEAIFNPSVLGFLDDGSFVMMDQLFDIPDQGFQDMMMQVTRHTPGGATLDTLGRWPFVRMGNLGEVVGAPHFEPVGSAVAAPEVIWVGLARAAVVDGYDTHGSLVRSVRWTESDRNIPATATALLLEQRLEDTPEEMQAALRRQHEARPIADRFPAYSRIMTGRDGLLRVHEYSTPADSTSNRWLIFDERGAIRARVHFPRSFRPLEWGEDYVTGVYRDDLDVEIARVYELQWE